jgi:High potential iron-sulfur protein
MRSRDLSEPALRATFGYSTRSARMHQSHCSRRYFFTRLALGVALLPLAAGTRRAHAANLLSVQAPEAKAVRYTEDAKTAKGASGGASCANCALYQGASGATQGPCQIFPGKEVKAAGWCSSWAGQM